MITHSIFALSKPWVRGAAAAVALTVTVPLLTAPAAAQQPENIVFVTQHSDRFSDLEREILRAFLRTARGDVQTETRAGPPATRGQGNANRGNGNANRGHGNAHGNRGHGNASRGLPPGIAMNLERGKPLPPGIARNHPPQEVRDRLPAREHYEIVIVDRNAYLISQATQMIVDILTTR
jgi:hypothetical protein